MKNLNSYHLHLKQLDGAKRLTKLKKEIEDLKEVISFDGIIVEPIGVQEAHDLAAKLREILELEIKLGITRPEEKYHLSIKYSYWR